MYIYKPQRREKKKITLITKCKLRTCFLHFLPFLPPKSSPLPQHDDGRTDTLWFFNLLTLWLLYSYPLFLFEAQHLIQTHSSWYTRVHPSPAPVRTAIPELNALLPRRSSFNLNFSAFLLRPWPEIGSDIARRNFYTWSLVALILPRAWRLAVFASEGSGRLDRHILLLRVVDESYPCWSGSLTIPKWGCVSAQSPPGTRNRRSEANRSTAS